MLAGAEYLVPNSNLCNALDEIIESLPTNQDFQLHNQSVTMPLIDKMAAVLGLDPTEVSLDAFEVCAPFKHAC